MFVRIGGVGATGVIHDTVGEALSSGTWTDALNMRFTGVEMQKMLEPEILSSFPLEVTTAVWMQFWADGLTTFLAVATGSNIWLYRNNGVEDHSWVKASRPEEYNTDGYWDSFAWGDTCIFNNGIDPPQIYNGDTGKFEDLPRWGLISTADDIFNNDPPSRKVAASCVKLVPFKGFLVAIGITESGLYQPNKVWWSDITNDAGYSGCPNWDYETPASLSGQIVVDPEGGAIRTGVQLNEQLIIYNDASSTAMSFVGGTYVMQFRRLFNKGAAGLHAVAEFNNQHFCVSQDQIYLHDGNQVNLIAKDRVEEEFFKRIGKGGRFGDGAVLWDSLQVVKNPDRKEIIISYTDPVTGGSTQAPSTCVPVTIVQQPVDGNSGSGTVTFTVSASGTEPITYQWFENGQPIAGETGESLTVPDTSTSIYYAVVDNPCGSAQSDVVTIVEVCVPAVITQQPVDYPIGLPPEVLPLYNSGVSGSWSGVDHMVGINSTTGTVAANYLGYSGVQVSRDGGQTWSFTDVNRSYNSGYKIESVLFSEHTGYWWFLPYRQEIRGSALDYSPDDLASKTVWWGSGGTQDIANAYTHHYVVSNDSEDIYGLFDNDDPANHYHWPHAPLDLDGVSSTNTGPTDPAAVYVRSTNLAGTSRSVWAQREIANRGVIVSTYGDEGGTGTDVSIWGKDYPQTGNNPPRSFTDCLGDTRRQNATDGTTAKFYFSGSGTTTITYSLISTYAATPPFPTEDWVFSRAVSNPVIAYDGTGWTVLAADLNDFSKLLVLSDRFDGEKEFTLEVAQDGQSYNKQLLWDSYANRWLYAYTSSQVVANEYYLVELQNI